jgi:hypothetical protein
LAALARPWSSRGAVLASWRSTAALVLEIAQALLGERGGGDLDQLARRWRGRGGDLDPARPRAVDGSPIAAGSGDDLNAPARRRLARSWRSNRTASPARPGSAASAAVDQLGPVRAARCSLAERTLARLTLTVLVAPWRMRSKRASSRDRWSSVFAAGSPMRPWSRYDDGVGIRKRRRRRPVAKLAEFSKCRRYYFSRGLPTSYIAARLNLSETTVRKWRRLVSTDHTFAQLSEDPVRGCFQVLRCPDSGRTCRTCPFPGRHPE